MRSILFPVLLATCCTPALAADPAITNAAERFGALESIRQISMSPDGGKIAFISPVDGGQVLYTADLDAGGAPKAVMQGDAAGGNLEWCGWVSSSRLVCSLSHVAHPAGEIITMSRMIAINADGTQPVKLTKDTTSQSMGAILFGGNVMDWDIPGKPGQVLMSQVYVPDSTNGTNIHSDYEGLGVDMVDTVSLKRSSIERARREAATYMSDGHGNVRIMGSQSANGMGYLRNRVNYSYRKPGSRDWQPLSKVIVTAQTGKGFEPYAIDRAKNVVYGFDDSNGFKALYSITLDESPTKALVLGRNDVDIDGVVQIGRDHRVVGATYATERRATEFFDPELKALSSALGKALPGQPNVEIMDASEGETKLLLLAWSDTNPGRFYRFDKASKRLEEILPVRTPLEGQKLAPMQAITYTAADGTKVPAYLTLPLSGTGKGLPAIVMPHGGPTARDEWGFDWLVQYFAARGYAVIQPNFRGSSGFGSSWFKQNGFKSWRAAVGDVNDAGRWLVQQGIAAPGKLGVFGWSYGGYAALQSQVLDPDLFKAVIAVAPVTDLERLRQDAMQYADGSLTSDFIGTGPHIKEGSPAQNAERFKAPVLMFHGDLDTNVSVGQSQLMADRLKSRGKDVSYVEFKGLLHNLADSKARTQLLSQSDAFLRKAFGMPAN